MRRQKRLFRAALLAALDGQCLGKSETTDCKIPVFAVSFSGTVCTESQRDNSNESFEQKTHDVNPSPAIDWSTLSHNRHFVSRMGEYGMTWIHKKVIRLNSTFLLENIFLCELFYSGLHENDILTDEMREEIQVGGSTDYYHFLHYCFLCDMQFVQYFGHMPKVPTFLSPNQPAYTYENCSISHNMRDDSYFPLHCHSLLYHKFTCPVEVVCFCSTGHCY